MKKIGIVIAVMVVAMIINQSAQASLFQPHSEFHLAIKAGDVKELEKLIAEHPNEINNRHYLQGRSPLMLAAELGQARMVKLLLNNGADPNQRTTNRNSALIYALRGETEGHYACARLLLNAGADPCAINYAYECPAHMAYEDPAIWPYMQGFMPKDRPTFAERLQNAFGLSH